MKFDGCGGYNKSYFNDSSLEEVFSKNLSFIHLKRWWCWFQKQSQTGTGHGGSRYSIMTRAQTLSGCSRWLSLSARSAANPQSLPFYSASPVDSNMGQTCDLAGQESVPTSIAACAVVVLPVPPAQDRRKEEVNLVQLPCWPGLPCKWDLESQWNCSWLRKGYLNKNARAG